MDYYSELARYNIKSILSVSQTIWNFKFTLFYASCHTKLKTP